MICYNRMGARRMRKVKYFIFTLVCMLVIPTISNAECDYQRQAELARKASNVQLNYLYIENQGFQVIMTNLTSDLYAVDMYGQRINGGEEKIFEYSSGTVSFDIYSVDTACSRKLITKSVNLPILNSFYGSDECKQFPEFKYCQLWGNYSIDDEAFQSEFNEYKTEREKKLTEISEKEKTAFDIIIEVLQQNVFMIIFFGIVIVIMIIYKLFNRHK